MTKILAIISTHGNELLGPNLLAYMLTKRSKLLEDMEFVMANPRAYIKDVRYTESDLNRSYGLGLDTYEGHRAKMIEERIRLFVAAGASTGFSHNYRRAAGYIDNGRQG